MKCQVYQKEEKKSINLKAITDPIIDIGLGYNLNLIFAIFRDSFIQDVL